MFVAIRAIKSADRPALHIVLLAERRRDQRQAALPLLHNSQIPDGLQNPDARYRQPPRFRPATKNTPPRARKRKHMPPVAYQRGFVLRRLRLDGQADSAAEIRWSHALNGPTTRKSRLGGRVFTATWQTQSNDAFSSHCRQSTTAPMMWP